MGLRSIVWKPRPKMPSTTSPRGYTYTHWVKFALPVLTSTTALAACVYLIVDCKSAVRASQDGGLGLFAHVTSDQSSNDSVTSACSSYAAAPLEISDEYQLRMAQVAAVIVVTFGGLVWVSLVLSPCWSRPNEVWPKLISIGVSLLIGNLQLLSVVKFIRFVVKSYPEQQVLYENRGVVLCSVCFWLLTAVVIGLCGVKPAVQNSAFGPTRPSIRRTPRQETKEAEHQSRGLPQCDSGETKDTVDVEEGLTNAEVSQLGQDGLEAIELVLSDSVHTLEK